MLAPLRPWFAAITLTQAALERTGFRGRVRGSALRQAGERRRQAHVGLETLLEQLGYLASVGDNQTLMLRAPWTSCLSSRKGFTEVMAAWQNGDQATLINLLKEEMAPPKLQAWLERPCWERNRNWVKKRPSLPNESFIVVGAPASLRRARAARPVGAAGLAHHAAHRPRARGPNSAFRPLPRRGCRMSLLTESDAD